MNIFKKRNPITYPVDQWLIAEVKKQNAAKYITYQVSKGISKIAFMLVYGSIFSLIAFAVIAGIDHQTVPDVTMNRFSPLVIGACFVYIVTGLIQSKLHDDLELVVKQIWESGKR